MRKLASFIAGLCFGLGLLLSGMANPAKVIGFLDLAGPWDPSLMLVMVGAMIFVVSHEVIPETHRNGHQTPATVGLMGGFAVMMFLDTAFG